MQEVAWPPPPFRPSSLNPLTLSRTTLPWNSLVTITLSIVSPTPELFVGIPLVFPSPLPPPVPVSGPRLTSESESPAT